MFIGTYNPAGALTFLGLCLAVCACWLSFHGYLAWAVICLIYSGVCDLFDGWLARKLKHTKTDQAFGLQIDSLADMAAFGLTPMIILLHSGFHHNIDLILFGFYTCAAAMRLAFFNLSSTASRTPLQTYTGLPVTYAALIFPVVLLLYQVLSTPAFIWLIRGTTGLMGFFFIIRISIPKPRGKAYLCFVILAICLTIAWAIKGK